MTTNTVSPETGRKLAAAGFPQPAPALGQWWGDGETLVYVFQAWIDEGHSYFIVAQSVADGRPIIDDYFDTRDFRGLVYLPTVGDILLRMPGYAVGRYNTSKSAFSSPEMAWLCVSPKQKEFKHDTEHEAAAAAYLDIREKK